ncbi:HIT domain-containing protein [Aeromicrobium tamlense]|uniref:ATP adenylyltransferase n=1 Tax=Aeromicrobium tamlense TaxID=375541 RepID=A0A8I0FVT0_9ACTN|nr:HIT domain-containing protein [Aeromicrobium tamlense]MBD1270366.1 HIT domain-containing protein [Aeromicrobium tamlense]MBD1271502.1 HIT domain-containing protein [Aeromicrobium tamlense]NYI37752.1 ATP adenylyltransferase [Aeromicrobium tamlense]
MPDPDGLERLWAPYRMAYVREAGTDAGHDDGCPFCAMVAGERQTDLIVVRGEHCFVAMNLYPYNPGHLMVLPNRHESGLTELTLEESTELTLLTQQAIRAIGEVSSPHGYNVGLNLGASAGGSISQHLHQHVVPRWGGDANFMTVVGRTKTLPQTIAESAELLRAAWPAVDQ